MKENLFVINSVEDFKKIRNLKEGKKVVIIFSNDIDLKEYKDFEPIDAHSNDVEIIGCYHEVKNLTIKKPNNNYVGLFSCVKNLTISNIQFNGILVEGNELCGSIAGEVIENLNVNNSAFTTCIRSDAFGGGIVGCAGDINTENIIVNTVVSGRGALGGIAGCARNLECDDKTIVNSTLCDSYRNIARNTATHERVGYLSSREDKNIEFMVQDAVSRLPVEIDEKEMKLLLSMCQNEQN